MPSVTYDGRSFMLDGRRIWLVSGSIHYARTPRELWAARIHSAKVAGLNTVETPVFWNRHEPRPGQFDFSGDNDLRHFVQLIGEAGLFCILRPGPYVGAGWDLGGLPPWLVAVPSVRLRTANGPYLEACSRYLTAVAEQVRDLQITSPGKGGPIILIQNEADWMSGDDKIASAYLGELARYLREGGLTVPTINSNNLWQASEAEIDGWSGSGDMLATVRQLGVVRPDQPRLVIGFDAGAATTWGAPAPEPADPCLIVHRLAEVLAAGGQFNINPFHGGTNFGFWGGRLPYVADGFLTTSNDHQAPVTECGQPGVCYAGVRRLCTFASRFGRVFANLDPDYQPVVVRPASSEPPAARGRPAKRPRRGGPVVVHASGPQGGVAFVFADLESAGGGPSAKGAGTTLVLPDGSPLPVETGSHGIAWCLLDTYLGGRSRLDYSNLSAFGLVGKCLVLFGPEGADGRVSINGSPLHVAVPGSKSPVVHRHEGLTLVVCNEEQIDTAFLTEDAVYIGAGGLTHQGKPLALNGARQCARIDADGEVSTVQTAAAPSGPGPGRGRSRIALSDWAASPATDYAAGTSARYASITGPADLTAMGSPFGLGWYRLRIKAGAAGAASRAHIALPHAGDRLHLFLDGEHQGIIGHGPGASFDLAVPLRKGAHTLVVLAENLGRPCGGMAMDRPKGLYGHVFDVRTLRPGKPSAKTGDPINVLGFRSPIWGVHAGELTLPERVTWTIQHRKRTPLMVAVNAFPRRAILLLNNKPVHFIDRKMTERFLFEPDELSRGNNVFQLSLLPGDEEGASPASAISFYECTNNISAKAEWAFAKWEPPPPASFGRIAKGGSAAPVWHRAHFQPEATETPLMFDATGLTKGQVYVNGRHVGRYFVATAAGKSVGPQTLYYVPRPWLRPNESNELLIFDEHGGNPAKCRLVYDAHPELGVGERA